MFDLPRLLAAGRRAGGQRHAGHRGAARRNSRARRRGRGDRGDADQAARRQPLAGAGQAGEEAESRRAHPLRRDARKHGLPAGDARRRGRGERARAARSRCASRFMARRSTRRSTVVGAPPLPPYIAARRPVAPSDRADYQTMFAREEGAVAAPTAGLHFTPELIARVEAAGAQLFRLTLHVGAGTFLPVKVGRHGRPRHALGMGPARRRDRRGAQRDAGAAAAASSPSARPRRGCSKAPPARTAARAPSRARRRSSSRPAIASAPSTCC